MSEFDFSKLGEQIGEKVESAVNSKQVQDFTKNIKQSIHSAMKDVKNSTKDTIYNEVNKESHVREAHPYVPPKKRVLPVVKNPGGGTAGILFTVFGSIASSIFGFLTVIFGAISILNGNFMPNNIGILGLALFWLASSILIFVGRSLWGTTKRFRNYIKVLEGKEFCEIKDLARVVAKKERYVIKDLKQMIQRGWFLEGHMDEQKTCFMATNESYQQYVQAEEALLKRQEEEARKKAEEELLYANPEGRAIKQIEEEGREYVRQIRRANDDIPGEIISQRLDRLEMISSKILEEIKKKPEKVTEIRKYMNYYMPTVLKLVNTYREFDKQPLQGENIRKGKAEIEESLDVVNNAFEKLFDQLFQEEMIDVSTDITVLATMLSKDGLLGNDFNKEE